jgi:hypothetical protein
VKKWGIVFGAVLILAGGWLLVPKKKDKAVDSDHVVDATMGVEPVEMGLRLLTLTGGQELKSGRVYTIKWEQKEDLVRWGDGIYICMLGFSGEKIVAAKKEWNGEVCTYREGTATGSYLISHTKLSDWKYDFTVPTDFLDRFENRPEKFKLRLLVLDELPGEGRSEWAGNVGYSESGDFLLVK